MATIKLGYAPTRRSIFSAPDAIKYRGLTADRLKELGIDFVDIDDINEEGLLYDDGDVKKIAAKFKAEGVDGLFLPHCNFGTEYVCARLAKELNVPVLLWGPLDERPDENGVRLRDTQCGLFATGKVLRRFQIPFTYMTNCRLNDPVFERGLRDFLAVCNVVKTFRNIRILQISTRPFDFWTTMCNEGELLEKFNIQLAPIPMTELTEEMKAVKAEGEKLADMISYINENMEVKIKENEVENVAALAIAMEQLIEKYGCQAAGIAQQTANWEKTEAYDKMEAMLQANPDIEGVICGNDTMLEGVCAALQAAGKTLPVIGVDGSDEAAALIKSGQATGTALQQFAVIAEMAVVQADQYLKEGSTGEDEKQLVDCIAITAENVDKLSGFVFTE